MKTSLTDRLVSKEAEVAKANGRVEDMLKLDEVYRKELTIALGKSLTPEGRGSSEYGVNPFSREKESDQVVATLSWSQIFMEIGRLREIKSRADLLEFLKGAKTEFDGIMERIRNYEQQIEKEARKKHDY